MIDQSYKTWTNKSLIKLLDQYEEFPFFHHPLWQNILSGNLTREQVLKAETQHYLRTRSGQALRKAAMEKCINNSRTLWESIIETYIEECTEEDGTPTHLNLIERFLLSGGVEEMEMKNARNTPGNIAAIALYKDISDRGAGCHIIGAGAVEFFYSQLSPYIFESYTKHYGFSAHAAETYSLHGVMDKTHAERAFNIVDEAIKIHGWRLVEDSVRDAFVATSLHYDGMLQAATGEWKYWDGKILNK